MKITLDLKPLSVNAAYRGRRFDTPAKKRYDRALRLMLPKVVEAGPYYEVHYRFFLVNFAATDEQNLLKCLTDGLVRSGIIRDDRYIVLETIEKVPANKDRVEMRIESRERPAFWLI